MQHGPFLALAVVLFLSGGIVLPTPGADAGDSLIDDFEKSGKLSLLLLAAYILFWVPANAWSEGSWLGVGVWFNIALTIPLLVTYYVRNGRLRNAAATVFFLAQAYGLLFVWSSPTDVG